MSDEQINTLAETLLPKIKVRLGEPEFNDDELTEYIVDTINELISLGVKDEVISSSSSLGAITKGVKDQWDYTDGAFSDDFYNRVDRLRRKVISNG